MTSTCGGLPSTPGSPSASIDSQASCWLGACVMRPRSTTSCWMPNSSRPRCLRSFMERGSCKPPFSLVGFTTGSGPHPPNPLNRNEDGYPVGKPSEQLCLLSSLICTIYPISYDVTSPVGGVMERVYFSGSCPALISLNSNEAGH